MTKRVRDPGSSEYGPDFAKSIALTSIAISRAMIVPRAEDDEDPPGTEWNVDGYRLADDVTFLLFGDLVVESDRWTVGATSTLALRIRRNTRLAKSDPEQVREEFPRIVAWLKHILYDVAAAKARQLVASVYPPPDIEIDTVTPATDHIRYFDYREGAFDADDLDEHGDTIDEPAPTDS